MKEEYISVAEFAKRAGISRQSVYNRLTKDLQPFLQVIDNKKCLSIKGLELFVVKNAVKEVVKVDKNLDSDLTIFLQRQIEEKDRQIERLTQMLDQEQKLHALAQQKVLLLEEVTEEKQDQEKAVQKENEQLKEELSHFEKTWLGLYRRKKD